jgi:hypothetical protein
MGLPCIERDDYALMLEIDCHIVHAFNFHERRAQLSHSLMVTFAFGGDFDRLQDRVVGSLREKRIGWIRITWPCRVHRFDFTYLTCDSRTPVAFYESTSINTWLQPGVSQKFLRSAVSNGFPTSRHAISR